MLLHSRIEGQGFPFIIMHGFLGMNDNWKTLATKFAALGFEVHSLDLRNHGKSFHSDDFSYQAMTADIIEYCSYYNISKANFLGHSMGGKLAMFLASAKPELINKLIIADMAPKYYAPHHQIILEALNAVDFSIKPSRIDVDKTISKYIFDEGTKQFLLKSLYWAEPGQLAYRFNLNVFNKNPEAIGQPIPDDTYFTGLTLFIRGGNSNYILDSDLDNILKYFPNAIIKTIPNVGHWLHAENPSLFFEFVSNFIND